MTTTSNLSNDARAYYKGGHKTTVDGVPCRMANPLPRYSVPKVKTSDEAKDYYATGTKYVSAGVPCRLAQPMGKVSKAYAGMTDAQNNEYQCEARKAGQMTMVDLWEGVATLAVVEAPQTATEPVTAPVSIPARIAAYWRTKLNHERILAMRKTLKLDQSQFAEFMRLKGKHARDTIYEWETGKRPISGPASLVVEALESGWRPD